MPLPFVIPVLMGGAVGLGAYFLTNKGNDDEHQESSDVRTDRKRGLRGRNGSGESTQQVIEDTDGDESDAASSAREEESGGASGGGGRGGNSDPSGEVETDDAETQEGGDASETSEEDASASDSEEEVDTVESEDE